jgi:hypothetical protein
VVVSIGHVFLVAQGMSLDKGTSRIVHALCEHDPLYHAGLPPHESYMGLGGFRCS